jgi:hypothetical protein
MYIDVIYNYILMFDVIYTDILICVYTYTFIHTPFLHYVIIGEQGAYSIYML